jgi:hypothetical protein
MKTLSSMMIRIIALSLVLTSCGKLPFLKMSKQERISDMQWIFSMYEQYYAPLKYKEKKFNFDNEELKEEYIVKAEADQENAEFFKLMQAYVAEFKDAHNSGALPPVSRSGQAEVAFIGFDGKRVGDGFYVEKLLPSYVNDTGLSVKVGDTITHMNGKTLKEAVDETLTQYRDLGRAESNYTYLMRNLFLRISLSHPMPLHVGDMPKAVNLTVKRGGKTLEVTDYFIAQGYLEFVKEQKAAVAAQSAGKKTIVMGSNKIDQNGNLKLMKLDGRLHSTHIVKFMREVDELKSIYESFDLPMPAFLDSLNFYADQTFEFIDDALAWSIVNGKKDEAGHLITELLSFDNGEEQEVPKADLQVANIKKLKKARNLPAGYELIVLGDEETLKYPYYPAYVYEQTVGIGEDAKKVKVGYVLIDTFSPSQPAAQVLSEFQQTIVEFKKKGVKSIVIDTINNGGGSLALGNALASALTSKEVQYPGIQLKANEYWYESLEKDSKLTAFNPTVRYAKKIAFDIVKKSFESDEWLTPIMPIQALENFGLTVDKKKVPTDDTKIVVLINEMCASMCDIFSATLQDNDMAIIMGAQSMGAGGNVVNHTQAPKSNFQVRMTESLIVRANGEYIENNGTTPDIALNVNADSKDKYKNIIKKAFKEAATRIILIPEDEAPAPVKPRSIGDEDNNESEQTSEGSKVALN